MATWSQTVLPEAASSDLSKNALCLQGISSSHLQTEFCVKASPLNSLGISSGETYSPKPGGLSSVLTKCKQAKRRLDPRCKDQSGHLLKLMQSLRIFFFCNRPCGILVTDIYSCGSRFKNRGSLTCKSRIHLFLNFVGLHVPSVILLSPFSCSTPNTENPEGCFFPVNIFWLCK